MKFFKKLTLFLLIFFITALMFLIQFTITFNSIVFSKDYIEESFDENNVEFLVTNEILNNNELLSYVTKDTDKQKILLKSMNKEWIDEQNPILIKGTYRYLIGEDDKLPTINIEPIKNNIVSIAVEEALKEYNVLLIPYIKEKVKSAVYNGLKIDKVSNTLDINILSEKLNSSGENPFVILKNLLLFSHNNLMFYLGIDVFLIFILFSIIKGNIFNSLKWSGLAFTILGIITVACSFLYKGKINYTEPFGFFIKDILGEFFKRMIIAGATSIIIGIIIVLLTNYVMKRSNKDFNFSLSKRVKALSILIMIIMLGFTNMIIYNNTLKPLGNLREGIKESDLGRAIIESTGAEFLK